MTKREVAELLKFLNDSYPNLEVTQSRIDTWSRLLKDQNPAVVMRNAERYVIDQKFPPTIADLRERRLAAHSNSHLEKVKQWEEKAIGYKPRS
ncbi:replicative helicase loader/inhibitor [Virgibacillus salexigens]|uniref:replicative helicase loader/inhibitor n=1 Tax=Virgibacillus salexigens TaxID=61016 RepID=UPI00190E0DA5|nr:replicative helicase loader/inhibitor [Virgibacillus salexigens]